ncbi:glutathione-disulfide reductase [Lutibaculum baratangense]|uniref:Glutathione reductase n=1 Tax=Lutibaculum baratangense AMV1 TaxID=631454 RepID=V4R9Q8_9HYPH|nr:glutathione-disulfide reductase [Lutibaculum baratangense]ESR22891.1 Glutathione reductase [Lutibaculum baratangense AMV1]
MSGHDYDLFVIGGGSGGVRAARVAAQTGAKVAIAERYRFGGTCVIRGCVPKKLLVLASRFPDHFDDSASYGWTLGERSFDWNTLIANKDKEIARLEGLYKGNLEKAGVETFNTRAELTGPNAVRLPDLDREITAGHILIATGGRPYLDRTIPGIEHAITSDDAFHLERFPKRIVIVGGGYIGVEFASIFNGLGAEVTLVHRGDLILRGFDHDLRKGVQDAMRERGVDVRCGENVVAVEKLRDGLRATLKGGERVSADQVMFAIGRVPNIEGLHVEERGIACGPRGQIMVDNYSQTSIPSIYAIGDVTDRLALTPVAIREGMAFVETVFRNNPTDARHELVPTAVFTTPEMASVGLTEEDARKRCSRLDIYKASFRPLPQTLTPRTERMTMKILVDGTNDQLVGIHILGPEAAEMIQILGVLVRMGATKADLDRTVAVHPTAAEELVTMREPVERVGAG